MVGLDGRSGWRLAVLAMCRAGHMAVCRGTRVEGHVRLTRNSEKVKA